MYQLSKPDLSALKKCRDIILAYHPDKSKLTNFTGSHFDTNIALRCVIEEKTEFSSSITSYHHIPVPEHLYLKQKYPEGFKIYLSAPDPLKFTIRKWEDLRFEIWPNNSSEVIEKANLKNEQVYLIKKNYRILVHASIQPQDYHLSRFNY